MASTLVFDRALLGTDLLPSDDAWITIDGGKIVAVGSGHPPVGAQRGPGRVAMPGLIDCHVHLALSGGANIQADAEALSAADAAERAAEHASIHAAMGVTTVRDLGSPHDAVIQFARRNQSIAPRIIPAGAISSRSGHGSFLAKQADSDEEYETELYRLATLKVSWVKLFATGGVITTGTATEDTQMSFSQLCTVVARAHSMRMRVAVHAHGHAGIENAINANVDTIEHFSYLTDKDVEKLQCRSTITPVSTYVATERFFTSKFRNTASPETLTKILAHAPYEREALSRAVAANLRLAAGTDAGTTFNPHGGGLQEQALFMRDAGMSSSSVLSALTVNGARALGVRAGVLAPGYSADILCLDKDPNEDLTALSRPSAIIFSGNRIGR